MHLTMALMKSQKIKWLVWTGAMAALLLAAAMVVISIFLPLYLESKLLPETARKFGLDPKQVQVRRIGWFGADLGPIDLDTNNTPVIRIASVHIDYSPLSLLRGTIQNIALGGVRVVLAATPKGLTLPGLTVPATAPSQKTRGALPDLTSLLPIGVEQLSLSQSEVRLLWKGRQLTIAMEMTLACGALDQGILTGRAELAIPGNTLSLTGALDQGANLARFTLQGSQLSLGTLMQIYDLPPHLSVSAMADLKGQTSVQLVPFELTTLSLTGHLTQATITTPQGTLQNLATPQGDLQPIIITLEAPAPPRINWQCGPFQINAPLKSDVLAFNGQWTPEPDGWSLTADGLTRLPAQTTQGGITLPQAVPLPWQIQARQAAAGALSFNAHTTGRHPLVVARAPFTLTCPTYQLDAKGRFENDTLDTEGTLTAAHIRLTGPDGDMTAPDLTLHSALSLPPPDGPKPFHLTARAVLSDVRSKQGAALFTLPGMEITAAGQGLPGQPWHYQANCKVTGAGLADPAHSVVLGGITIDLPLQWPPAPKAAAGHVAVRTIQWNNRQLGDLKGRLEQQHKGLAFSVRHASKLFPNLNVLADGTLDATGGTLNARLPAYSFPKEFDLGRLATQAAGLYANGQIAGSAKLWMNNSELNGSATLRIDQGSVRHTQRKLALEGIHMALDLENLMTLKSAPQQRLRVAHLSFGNLVANDLQVDFQLEGPHSFFVEKTRIQWCQGRIDTTALRIDPDKQTYDVTLFCDRLNLAMVLEQFGAGQASGEGAVNGIIPLHWDKGRLSFEKGFLYSTPGKPGVIQLEGTQVLLSGLPPETPQHTQVDIATEALKDYTYQWAKLQVESQDENLLLKLQLEGKPNRLLPFAFDQQLGRFKRVSGQGQAEFKGIGIDLNFKSPLNKILHYKELLTPNQ
jgi:hypothetical protein